MSGHICFIALIALVSLAATVRNGAWMTETDTWSDSVKKSPLKSRPYNGSGKALMDNGFYDEALPLLKKAVALQPSDSFAHNNLAVVFYKKRLAFKGYGKISTGAGDADIFSFPSSILGTPMP